MENINIKDYIINNFKEDNIDTIRKAIEQSIEENDDVVLPGLGVFLTLIWQGSNEKERKNILEIIHKELKKQK